MSTKDNDHLEQIRDDFKFLLSFVPETDPGRIDDDLMPMFYVTGSYQGDVDIANRASKIMEKYGINKDEINGQ